jgi:hypothetical protein
MMIIFKHKERKMRTNRTKSTPRNNTIVWQPTFELRWVVDNQNGAQWLEQKFIDNKKPEEFFWQAVTTYSTEQLNSNQADFMH